MKIPVWYVLENHVFLKTIRNFANYQCLFVKLKAVNTELLNQKIARCFFAFRTFWKTKGDTSVKNNASSHSAFLERKIIT